MRFSPAPNSVCLPWNPLQNLIDLDLIDAGYINQERIRHPTLDALSSGSVPVIKRAEDCEEEMRLGLGLGLGTRGWEVES
jgi:hypothetical protein